MALIVKIAQFVARLNDAFNEALASARRPHAANIRSCRRNDSRLPCPRMRACPVIAAPSFPLIWRFSMLSKHTAVKIREATMTACQADWNRSLRSRSLLAASPFRRQAGLGPGLAHSQCHRGRTARRRQRVRHHGARGRRSVEPAAQATFVVENRPGAGGTIGSGVVASAAPDGTPMLAYRRARDRERDLHEAFLRHPQRFRAGDPVRHPAAGDRRLAGKVQDARRADRGRPRPSPAR